ncbi:MAG TPA: AMP-binding protein, partial [Streptosporangiaceae bacterium]
MPVESFNASVYLLDRQVEAGRGGHLAVTGPAGSLTYAELSQRVAELSSGLQALGVRPEERVLLVTSDRPETVITFLALLRVGAVAVPVSTMYNGTELGELLRDTRARVVVATGEFAAAAREAMRLAPEASTLVLAGESTGGEGDASGPPGTDTRSWADVLA